MGYIDYWTVQDKNIFTQVTRGGYVPSIQDSAFLKEYSPEDEDYKREMVRLYNTVVTGFCTANEVCQTDMDSVIFAFAKLSNTEDGARISFIETFDEFYNFIQANQNIVKSCWNALAKNPDAVIMHLRFPDTVKPVAIDLNGWSYCMPPFFDFPGALEIRRNLLDSMAKGENQYSGVVGTVENDVIQCHLPYIREENLVACYPMFPLFETEDEMLALASYLIFVKKAFWWDTIEEEQLPEKIVELAKSLPEEGFPSDDDVHPNLSYWMMACQTIRGCMDDMHLQKAFEEAKKL